MNQLHPKIYVVCLAAYHQGRLHGKWIGANQSIEIIKIDIHNMLLKSPVENAKAWMIYAQGDFGGIYIHPDENLKRISELAQFVAQYGELGAALFNHFSGDFQQAIKVVENDYLGAYENEEDFACQYFDKTVKPMLFNTLDNCDLERPNTFYGLIHHINCKNYINDLFADAFLFLTVSGKVHAFKNT